MTEKNKEALELAMTILGRDRTWGPALEERLKGLRYRNPHPLNGEWIFPPGLGKRWRSLRLVSVNTTP
jgi:hypothetical protein